MKKAYEFPKAEKMTFDYSDVVVASSTGCTEENVYTLEAREMDAERCHSFFTGQTVWTKNPS